MSKRPAFQFYPSDWRNDLGLRLCSAAARGLWIDMLCIMHEGEPYGHLTILGRAVTSDALAKLTGESPASVRKWLSELRDNAVFTETPEGIVFSRRMVRDEQVREARAAGGSAGAEHGGKGASHGAKGGRPRKDRGDIGGEETGDNKPPLKPPPSSSSSSSGSVSDETGAKAPSDPIAELRSLDPKTAAWRLALKVLMDRGGYPATRARPIVGKWCKDHATAELWHAAEAAWNVGTLDPVSYITEALKGIRERADGDFDPMLTPEDWRQRKWMEEFVEGRFQWAPARGPEPGQPGCRVAPELQREFGVEPAQPAAARRRRAVANERAKRAVDSMLADLPEDVEFTVEVIRAGIRRLSAMASGLVGSSRALGLLAGSAADICPAYQGERRFSEAEALFKTDRGDA